MTPKHPGGRPTAYSQDVLKVLEDYIASCGREATELPTHEGLAILLGVNTDTIQEWKKKHPEFSVACKSLMDYQKNQLINDGLYGGKEVNQAMAIFLLKANHGLVETSHTDITSAGKPIPILGAPDVHQNVSNDETTESN